MTDVINKLTTEIEKHRSKLTELEEQRKKLELEIPVMKSNIEALTRSLNIIQGKPIKPDGEQIKESLSSTPGKNRGLREGSQSALAYSILKEANSPLTMAEVFNRASGKKSGISYNSFTSGIYNLSRKKRYFKVKSGKISLLE
jgi:predicted RNase H-like nuclease (RuvC/YqgF family)